MKKIIIILSLSLSCLYASSQSISTDSLSTIIRTLQKQVVTIQSQLSILQSQMAIVSKIHTITFDTSFVVQNVDSLDQIIHLAPTVNLSTINATLTNLQTQYNTLDTKVYGLKATSITTTTIQ